MRAKRCFRFKIYFHKRELSVLTITFCAVFIFIFSCLTVGFAQSSNNQGLIITEIMYDPTKIDDSKGEYLELCFFSENETFFDLSKCSFQGITFTFPENTYINSSNCFVIAREIPENETDFDSFLYYFNNSDRIINNKTVNELLVKNLFDFNGNLNNDGDILNLVCQDNFLIQINYTNTLAKNNGKSINYYCNKEEEQDPNPFYYNFNRICNSTDENSIPEINLNQNDYNLIVNESIEINFSVLDDDNDVLWINVVNLSEKGTIKIINQSNYQITFESEDEGKFIFQIKVSDSMNTTEEIISINVTERSYENNDQEGSEGNNSDETPDENNNETNNNEISEEYPEEENNNEPLEENLEDDPCKINIEDIQVTDNKVEYYIKSKNNQLYEYWIEDLYGTILKSKSESTTSTKKSYTDSKNNLYVIINARSNYASSCEIKREVVRLNVELNRNVNFEIDDLSYKKLIVSISISNMATKINFDCYLNDNLFYSNEFKPKNLISYNNQFEINIPQQIIKNGENNIKCVLDSEKDYIEKHDFFIYSVQTNNNEKVESKSEEQKIISYDNYCSLDSLNNNFFSFYTMERNLKEENIFYFNPKKDFDFEEDNLSLIILENKLNIKIDNDSKQDFKIKLSDENTKLYAILLENNNLISSIQYNVSLKNQNNLSNRDSDQITEDINSNEKISENILSSMNTNNTSFNFKTNETSLTYLNNNKTNKQPLTGELFSFELNENNNESRILMKFSLFILIFVILSFVFYKKFNRLKIKKQNSNLNNENENKLLS